MLSQRLTELDQITYPDAITHFRKNGTVWHLHGRLVVQDGDSVTVPVCASCQAVLDRNKIPRFNVANVDFGFAACAAALTDLERLVHNERVHIVRSDS